MKKIECMEDIIEKIKNKDFEITYAEAIELWKVSQDWRGSVNFIWVETMGSTISKLMYVELEMFSGVKLHIK